MKKIVIFVLALISFANVAFATTYTYVGSWHVSDGPNWTTNPAVYSGQEAAAYLFGGSASEYAISTISSNPSDINFSAFLDGWADAQYLYNPQPQDWKLDMGLPGYNDPSGIATAYSAFVQDHSYGENPFINFAFRVDNAAPVPEPGTFAMLAAGLGGLAIWRKRRQG